MIGTRPAPVCVFDCETGRIRSVEREFQLGVNGRYEISAGLKWNALSLPYKSLEPGKPASPCRSRAFRKKVYPFHAYLSRRSFFPSFLPRPVLSLFYFAPVIKGISCFAGRTEWPFSGSFSRGERELTRRIRGANQAGPISSKENRNVI